MSNVFIAFQHNEESRPVIDAIVAENGAVALFLRDGALHFPPRGAAYAILG